MIQTLYCVLQAVVSRCAVQCQRRLDYITKSGAKRGRRQPTIDEITQSLVSSMLLIKMLSKNVRMSPKVALLGVDLLTVFNIDFVSLQFQVCSFVAKHCLNRRLSYM